MPADLAFRIFGGVGASVDDVAVRLGGLQSQRLLGILLAQDAGRPVTVAQLVEALSQPDAAIRPGAVHVAVRRLRTRLDRGDGTSPLQTVDGGYVLERASFDLDDYEAHVGRAEQLVGDDPRGAFAELDLAMQQWHDPWGELAAEPWAEDTVRRLEVRHLSVEDRWAELAVGAADVTDLTDRIADLAAAEPLREDRWESLIRALYRAGRQVDALRAFETAREQLRDASGLEPGPRLRELERRVLLQDPLLDHRRNRVRVVGAPTERFVGRGEQLDLLSSLDTERLVTVTGFGGVGKSRLVTEHLALTPRGHALVELRSLTEPTQLARHVAAELGVAVHDREADDVEPLVYALDDTDRLLVLDNADVALDEVADLVVRLLATLPRLQVLATSTVPLGVPGERLVRLDALPVPELGEPTEGTAVELVAVQLGRPPDERAHDLARQFGGLPLPLRIAAANEDPTGPPAERGDFHGAELAVSSALDLALAHTSSDARGLLALLSVLPDGAGRELLAAVDDESLPDRQRLLRELTIASLVQPTSTGSDVRFGPLEPVRALVDQRLDDTERDRWLRVGTAATRRLTDPAAPDSFRPSTRDELESIESERRTVLGLLSTLLQHDPDEALDLAISLDTWWWESGRTVEGNDWVARAMERARPDGVRRARAICALASTSGGVLALGTHRSALDEAVDLVRRDPEDHPGLMVKLLGQQALAAGLGGDLATCDAAVAEARAIVTEHATTPWADAELDRYHALRFALVGRPAEGVEAALAAADQLERLGQPAGAAGAVYFASVMGRMAGLTDMSELLQRGLDLAVTSGSRMQVALMQAELAQHQRARRAPDALEQLRRAAEAVERIGNTRTAAVCRRDLGLELLLVDRADEAVPELLRAARGLIRVDPSASAPALAALASHADTTPEVARTLARAARERSTGTGTPLVPEELELVAALTSAFDTTDGTVDTTELHELLGELRAG